MSSATRPSSFWMTSGSLWVTAPSMEARKSRTRATLSLLIPSPCHSWISPELTQQAGAEGPHPTEGRLRQAVAGGVGAGRGVIGEERLVGLDIVAVEAEPGPADVVAPGPPPQRPDAGPVATPEAPAHDEDTERRAGQEVAGGRRLEERRHRAGRAREPGRRPDEHQVPRLVEDRLVEADGHRPLQQARQAQLQGPAHQRPQRELRRPGGELEPAGASLPPEIDAG